MAPYRPLILGDVGGRVYSADLDQGRGIKELIITNDVRRGFGVPFVPPPDGLHRLIWSADAANSVQHILDGDIDLSGSISVYETEPLLPYDGILSSLPVVPYVDCSVLECGWPLCSMVGADANIRPGHGRKPEQHTSIAPFWEIESIAGFDMNATLPLQPIPIPFALNTLMYAGLLWLVMSSRSIRRWLRIRRGHCPICKYDLRGDIAAGCPECGWNRADQPRRT